MLGHLLNPFYCFSIVMCKGTSYLVASSHLTVAEQLPRLGQLGEAFSSCGPFSPFKEADRPTALLHQTKTQTSSCSAEPSPNLRRKSYPQLDDLDLAITEDNRNDHSAHGPIHKSVVN